MTPRLGTRGTLGGSTSSEPQLDSGEGDEAHTLKGVSNIGVCPKSVIEIHDVKMQHLKKILTANYSPGELSVFEIKF